jgi:hypothetical protein
MKACCRDLRKMTLTDDEKEWMDENSSPLPRSITDWALAFPTKISLVTAFSDVHKLLTERRRRDLRLLHGGRMRKIQEMADEGKIGALLKSITGKREPFTMESIRDGDRLITDPHEISRLITSVFREWFFRSEKEAWRDHNISDAIIGGDIDRFMEVAASLGVTSDVAGKVWEICKAKPLERSAELEMEKLDEYTPTFP